MRSILLIVCLTLSMSFVGFTAAAEVPSGGVKAGPAWVSELGEVVLGFVKGWFAEGSNSSTQLDSGGTTDGGPALEPDGLLGGPGTEPDGLLGGPTLEPDGRSAGPGLEPDGAFAGPTLEPDGR